jgi:hypothetical protein
MGLVQERQKKDKERMLEALCNTYGIVSEAVKIAGISRRIHYEWLHSDEEYKKAVQDVKEIAKDFVEGKLFECIKEKNITGIIFYLKTQAKDRGYAERELTDSINVGEIKVQVVHVDGGQDNQSILPSE